MARGGREPDTTPHKHDWGRFKKKREWEENGETYYRYERTCKDKTCNAKDIHPKVRSRPRG